MLASEIDKLALHVGEGKRIEVAHVDAVVPATRMHEVYELTNRLATGDQRGACVMLRRILGEGEPPVRLLAFLASNLRGALHVAELREQVTNGKIEVPRRRLRAEEWVERGRVGEGLHDGSLR